MARLFVTVLGSALFFAGSVCASEDVRDSPVVTALVKQALEFERSGTDVPWSNPETGNGGVIRVERTYFLNADTPCRDYIRTSERQGGDRTVTKGTGCRMEDGRWLLDEQPAAEASPGSKGDSAFANPRGDSKVEKAGEARPKSPEPKALTPPKQDAKGKAAEKNSKSPSGGTEVTAASPDAPRAKPKIVAPIYTLPSKSEL